MSTLSYANDARKQLFAFGNRKIEKVPPALHGLEQHINRAVYQAGYIWGQCLNGEPEVHLIFEGGRKWVTVHGLHILRSRRSVMNY